MKIWFSCTLVSLLLPLAPAFGQPAPLQLGAKQCAASPHLLRSGPAIVTTQGTCSVNCGDMGGTVTVQCTGICTIVDQNCDAGVQGYVECQGGARADCAPCEWCTAEGPCPEGGWISCGTWGYSGSDCSGGNGACYVECDGQFDFCPGHEGQIWCGF